MKVLLPLRHYPVSSQKQHILDNRRHLKRVLRRVSNLFADVGGCSILLPMQSIVRGLTTSEVRICVIGLQDRYNGETEAPILQPSSDIRFKVMVLVCSRYVDHPV